MNKLLISYDLMRPGQDYEDLWKYLRGFPKHKKPLLSVWVVKTSKSAEDVRNHIVDRLLDSNDKLVVVDVTDCAAFWRNTDWLKNSEI